MEELIRMSDVPEIQDRWKPKVGDRVYIKRHEVYGHIVQIEGNDIIHVTSDDGQTYWRNTRDELIYIPRIEDVLEWLSGWSINLNGNGLQYIVVRRPGVWTANNPLTPLIKAYMHLEHNKTWNGEGWV
jgi:hypothetical protein